MDTPAAPKSPTEFTIGGRTYELVAFVKEGEHYVSYDTMVQRAKELNANFGTEDRQFVLEHQDEIPKEYRGKFYLAFTDGLPPLSYPPGGTYLCWNGYRWSRRWFLRDRVSYYLARLVRRVK